MTKKPRIHVPQPTARPAEAPDFSYLKLAPAGAADRPPSDAPVADTAYLAHDLVRVLDDEHVAQGPWAPQLTGEELVRALELMVLTRVFDDRMQRMQRQGKITFYMQALGEEAVSEQKKPKERSRKATSGIGGRSASARAVPEPVSFPFGLGPGFPAG